MTAPDLALARPRAGWRLLFGPDAAARLITGFVILALWEFATWMWAPAFVARPSGVLAVAPQAIANPAMWVAAWQTISAVLQGLVLAIVFGTIIGLAIGRVPMVERLLQLYVSGLFAMPMVAILPLLTLYFGYTGDARLATVVFAAIFAIIINVSDGARSVPPEYIEVSRAFRGSPWSRLFDVVLPASMPYLIAGLKLAAGRSLIGAVIAEFYAALPGLGYFILYNTRTFKHNEALVAVLLLALIGVLFEFALSKGTTKLFPWYRRDEARE